MNNAPIGIFDSGVGGLSVYKELKKILPKERFVYLADSANCPYGNKPYDEIINYSVKNTDYLLEKEQCKLVVVACNTATAASIDLLRKKFNIPFVGMEPAIKPAAQTTATGRVGVLATQGTFEGRLYKQTSKRYAKGVEQIIQVGNGLVEIVESGQIKSEYATVLLNKYLQPMIDAGVDRIVLGCTHYPFLEGVMESIIPEEVKIINPAPAVAKRVKYVLQETSICTKGDTLQPDKFLTTGDSRVLKRMLSVILGSSVYSVNKIQLR